MKAFLILTISFWALFAQAQTSTGLKNPSATGEDYNTWDSPANAYVSDDVRALVIYTILPAAQDYYNFGFGSGAGLPAGSTLDSVVVKTEVFQDNANPYNAFLRAELSKNSGTNYTSTGNFVQSSVAFSDRVLSIKFSAANLSGWGPTDFSNANFRLRLTFTDEDYEGPPWYSNVDNVQVIVYYTEEAPPGESVSGSLVFPGGRLGALLFPGGRSGYLLRQTILTPDENGIYFDSENGDDDNPGTFLAPYQSMTKLQELINNNTIIAGSRVYCRCGSRWDEVYITIDNSGAAGNHIKFTAYGSGPLPIITALKNISGGFSQSGNHYTKTDSDLPASMTISVRANSNSAWNFQEILPFVFLDGIPYNVSKYPNSSRSYLDVSNYSGDFYSYFDCATSWPNGYWNGAEILMNCTNWGMTRRTVNTYSSGRFNLTSGSFGANAEAFNYDGGEQLKFNISNHANAQDNNGEWVYNYSTKTLDILHSSSVNSMTVEAPVMDYVIRIDNADYIDISDLDIRSGIIAGIYVYMSDSVNITDCKVQYSGHAGILIGDCNNTKLTNNLVRYCANNGIKDMSSSGTSLIDCRIWNIGMQEGMGGDLANGDYEGYHSLYRDNGGSISMINCHIDSTGYNGFSIQGLLGTEGNVYLYGDLVQHTNYQSTDGGGGYINLDTAGISTPRTKIIRKCIFRESWGNKAFNNRGAVQSVGLYMDNQVNNYTVDSCIFFRMTRPLWSNEGQKHMKMNHNLLVDFDENGAGSSEKIGNYWATIESCWYPHPHGKSQYKNESRYNTIVSTSESELGQYWYYDNTSCTFDDYGNLIDYNKYHNGFSNTNYMAASRGYQIWTETYYTLDSWRAFSGFDMNSTFNANNWKFSNTTGITEDQFVWLFSNWSGTSHLFGLGSASFKDIDGNTVSGSVNIPAHQGIVLFYASGILSGVDNPFYKQ
jgi:parallel beta-helix repeat protein